MDRPPFLRLKDGLAERRNIHEMSTDEIMRLFEWLDFKDDIGHPLTNHDDFIQLVEQATSEKLILHLSDCATHNEPAYPKGECDCGAIKR